MLSDFKKIIIAGVVSYLVYLFGDISVEFAVLFFLIMILYFYVEQIEKREEKFNPFCFQVLPKWNLILKDYSLADENRIKELNKIILEKNPKEYNILSQGISFTVVGRSLVYYDSRQRFASKIDFREKIKELKIIRKKGNLELPFTPELFIRETYNFEKKMVTYQIGITTPESWDKVVMVGDNRDLVVLAEIPFTEFQWYFHGGIPNEKQIGAEKKLLEKFGWKDTTDQPEDLLFSLPNQLEHKYFTVYYWEI